MITDEDIRRTVAPSAFDAGLRYHVEGRVLDIRPSSVGSTLHAEVKGGGRSPYCQSIHLGRAPNGKVLASGSCTCPVGFNCKHVAAVLFECQDQVASNRALAALLPPQPGLSFAEDTKRLNGIDSLAPRSPPADAPLPYDVDAWLRSLDAAQEEDSEDYPPTVRKRLLYVLDRGPCSIQSLTAMAINSGLLSERMNAGAPRAMNRSASASITSAEVSLRATRIDQHFNLPQLGGDVLRRVTLARHSAPPPQYRRTLMSGGPLLRRQVRWEADWSTKPDETTRLMPNRKRCGADQFVFSTCSHRNDILHGPREKPMPDLPPADPLHVRSIIASALMRRRDGRRTQDRAEVMAIAAAEHLAEMMRLNGLVICQGHPAPNHGGTPPEHSPMRREPGRE